MSADVKAAAVRASSGQPLPYVHRVGCDVVLVLRSAENHLTRRIDASFQHVRCSSAGVARAVEARVLTDLRNFPDNAGRILRVSELYAEAAIRFARHRARKEVSCST